MNKVFPLLFIIALFCSGCVTARLDNRDEPIVTPEPERTIYEIASALTGCPARILYGIAFAESSNGRNLNHPDKLDRGYFGLHESAEIRGERVKKWGNYNPDVPIEAALIAGKIYMENLHRLGNVEDAIAALFQGAGGVRKNGRNAAYVNRVLTAI